MKNNDQTYLLYRIEDVRNMTIACLDNKMIFLFGHANETQCPPTQVPLKFYQVVFRNPRLMHS